MLLLAGPMVWMKLPWEGWRRTRSFPSTFQQQNTHTLYSLIHIPCFLYMKPPQYHIDIVQGSSLLTAVADKYCWWHRSCKSLTPPCSAVHLPKQWSRPWNTSRQSMEASARIWRASASPGHSRTNLLGVCHCSRSLTEINLEIVC